LVKKMDFDKIALSKEEFKTLQRIDKEKEILLSEIDEPVFRRLYHFRFVTHQSIDHPEKGHVSFTAIRDEGHDYLMYIKGVKSAKRKDNIKYGITTLIAILALVLSGIALAAESGLIKLPIP